MCITLHLLLIGGISRQLSQQVDGGINQLLRLNGQLQLRQLGGGLRRQIQRIGLDLPQNQQHVLQMTGGEQPNQPLVRI